MRAARQRAAAAAAATWVFLLGEAVLGLNNGVGLTPAMGWNTWNRFRCDISENLIREVAQALVTTGLKDAGYNYVVIDDCWADSRDADGHIVPSPAKFPSGMRALGDYLHGLGLRYGIYSDTANYTCEYFPGSYGHEHEDAADYASWGVDFLKYDYCGMEAATQPPRYYYEKMRDALNATGRPILFSICTWGVGDPHEWGPAVGNSWRTGPDLFAVWDLQTRKRLHLPALFSSITQTIEKQATYAESAGPGAFNDPDMLTIGLDGMTPYGQVDACPGHLGKGSCKMFRGRTEYIAREMWGEVGGLTETEQRSVFSFWSMMAAPLMLGNDPRHMRSSTLRILTHRELIAISQDALGLQARRTWKDNSSAATAGLGLQVWRKDLSGGKHALLLFNGGERASDITTRWKRDLADAASRHAHPVSRNPPCVDSRKDCAAWAKAGQCNVELESATHAQRKADCRRSCAACPPALWGEGRQATASVFNAWEREDEGNFTALFTAKHVEPHEARVYIVRFLVPSHHGRRIAEPRAVAVGRAAAGEQRWASRRPARSRPSKAGAWGQETFDYLARYLELVVK